MWVRDGRYFVCTCSTSLGEPAPAEGPPCFRCHEPMRLQLGTKGRWVGRWFWYCDEHVLASGTDRPRHLPGPGVPGKVHWGV